MQAQIIDFDRGDQLLDWAELGAAFERGHLLPRAEITDSFLYRGQDTLLNRAAWIDGLGLAVKSATVFPGNPAQGHPMVNGGLSLFDDQTGALSAIIDFHLVTKWKTAGDSVFAAKRLARADSQRILIVGAGTVGHSLYQAYGAMFPDAQIAVWNRTGSKADDLATLCPGLQVERDLPDAVGRADIICCATMSTNPVLRGEWLRPGQHIDAIGAYRPDMRELDDAALTRGRLFVDSYATTLDHIGELKIPLAEGTITRADVLADYYDLANMTRHSDDDITIFKNGGGAHLDLMTSAYILDRWNSAG